MFREVAVDKAQALKPLEEAAEVFGAFQLLDEFETERMANKLDSRENHGILYEMYRCYRTNLLDECADVCQAVANLLFALGVDGDEWASAVGRCEKRNRDRGRY